VAVVDFLAAPVEVPQHGVEVDAGGVHYRLGGNLEGGRHRQQLAAHRADVRIEVARIHQRLNEIRQQQHIRVQGHHPVAVSQPHGLVLRGGEPGVFLVVDDLAAVFELFQDVDGAVGRGVVNDDNFPSRIPLFEHRFQASLDKTAAIISYDRDGYEVVMGHELEPELMPITGKSVHPCWPGARWKKQQHYSAGWPHECSAGQRHHSNIYCDGRQASKCRHPQQHPGYGAEENSRTNYSSRTAAIMLGCEP